MRVECAVGGVGPFAVARGFGRIADLGQLVERRIVDVRAIGYRQRREICVGDIVEGEGDASRSVEGRSVVAADLESRARIGRTIVDREIAEAVAAADDIDLVAVRLFLVGALDRDVGLGRVPRRMRRIDCQGGIEAVVGEPVLERGFDIPRYRGADVILSVVVGRIGELAAIAEAAAVIIVAAQLDVGERLVDLERREGRTRGGGESRVVDIVFLDVVETAPVVAPRSGDDERERLVLAAELRSDREIEVERPAMIVRRFVAVADRTLDERMIDSRRRPRGQLDRTPSPSASRLGSPVLVTMKPSIAPVGMVSNSTARPLPKTVPAGLVLSRTTPP
jgi:hypothetical protein